jgi:hypothetical protein
MLRASAHPTIAEHLLSRATVWLCDRYELGERGLAAHDASPRQEVERLLGSPYESVALSRRRSSQAAAVLLDLCALFGLGELYADAQNDLRAVSAYPLVLIPGEGSDRYLRAGLHNRWDYSPDYADELAERDAAAPHLNVSHAAPLNTRTAWRLLATSSALRDRHFPDAIRTFVEDGP